MEAEGTLATLDVRPLMLNPEQVEKKPRVGWGGGVTQGKFKR